MTCEYRSNHAQRRAQAAGEIICVDAISVDGSVIEARQRDCRVRARCRDSTHQSGES